MFDRLKTKWGVTSTPRMWLILLAFSLAGSSIGFLKRIFWPLLGFTPETSLWIRVPTYILIMVPMYQVSLLFFGTLLGQFRFFWAWEKKFVSRMGRLFGRRDKPAGP
jgi:hypothetical protein